MSDTNLFQIMISMYFNVAHQGNRDISHGEKVVLDKIASFGGQI